MRKKSLILSLRRSIIFVVFLLVLLSLIGITSSGQTLAENYAPIFYFEAEETCYPVDVLYHIENSYLYVIGDTQPISSNPTEIELSQYSSDQYQHYYLDNQKDTVEDFDGIISDYQNVEGTLGYTVYYRVYQDTSSGATIIQYWMFYAFNKGDLNQHEGDWEMVQVVTPSDGSKWVAYSQHHSGQWATWNQVERGGDNIKVYVARGSHANYLHSFSGKLGVAGDNVGDNGKILKPGEYTLKNLENQLWLDYRGRWGECGNDITEFASAEALGQNGPLGPKYGEGGAMWDDPISWGKSIPQANDLIFMGEWFLYNFVLIFILLTILSLALTGFFIYRRHKKHGLGPRIVSLLYIDGANLKSIGNILCIVGIIVAIIGLFHPWYEVSYDISEIGGLIGVETTGGMQNLMKIDGIDGVQITIPGEGGPMPLGTVSIPFSLLIGISLVFLVIATIGISHSKKLGWKYSWRGVRLLIPVILILIVIIALGSIIPSEAVGGSATGNAMSDILSSISSSPFGGQKTFYISYQSINIPLLMQWGLGLGAQLLLMAGIIILAAGILEFSANAQFFTPKILHQASAQPIMPYQQPPTGQQPSQPFSESPKEGPKVIKHCAECGAKLDENATFCRECGKKTS